MTAKEQGLLRECFSCGTIHGGALCCGPIERDPKMERDYIPMPGGWEIQTKGKGSTFRICDKDGDRLAIPDSPYLHETIERMARDVNAAALASDTGESGVVRLTLTEELQQKCSDWGAYWRAPDAHGVILSTEQALELLRDALGVEVEIKAALRAQPAGGGDIPQWALPAVESALSMIDLQGYWHSDLAAFRDWLKEKSQ